MPASPINYDELVKSGVVTFKPYKKGDEGDNNKRSKRSKRSLKGLKVEVDKDSLVDPVEAEEANSHVTLESFLKGREPVLISRSGVTGDMLVMFGGETRTSWETIPINLVLDFLSEYNLMFIPKAQELQVEFENDVEIQYMQFTQGRKIDKIVISMNDEGKEVWKETTVHFVGDYHHVVTKVPENIVEYLLNELG